MELELSKEEQRIIERSFNERVLLDSNFKVVDHLSELEASYIVRADVGETVDEFKQKIIDMRTTILNIRNDIESFRIPFISANCLDRRRVDIVNKLVYARYNLGPFYVKLSALKFKKNKKIKLELLGAFVYVHGEAGIKIIIPEVNDAIQCTNDLLFKVNEKFTFILGGTEMCLDNPRRIRYTNLVVCDFKYKNGGIK